MATLLLTFRGLTAFVLEGRPFHAVLVDGAKAGHHPHTPVLTFAAEDFDSFDPQATELATVAAADGSMTGVWPLQGLELKITSAPATPDLTANGLQLIEDAPHPRKIHPSCLTNAPGDRPVAARVDLTSGTVSAQEIHIRKESVSQVSYLFTTADTTIVIEGASLAGAAGITGKLTLTPKRAAVVEVAITNWPGVRHLKDDHKKAYNKLLSEASGTAGSGDHSHHSDHKRAREEAALALNPTWGLGLGCDPMKFGRP